jgi:transposase
MAKLKKEVIKKFTEYPPYKSMLVLSANVSEPTVYRLLAQNKENGNLTKIKMLECIKELLGYDNIEQLLDRSKEQKH